MNARGNDERWCVWRRHHIVARENVRIDVAVLQSDGAKVGLSYMTN
jgi:hypothetical protein